MSGGKAADTSVSSARLQQLVGKTILNVAWKTKVNLVLSVVKQAVAGQVQCERV